MGKYIAAVDLGTTKVVTILGEKTSQGVKILGIGEELSSGGVMRGEVVNIQRVKEALQKTVETVNGQVNTRPDVEPVLVSEVYVGIGGQEIITRSDTLLKVRGNANNSITKEEMDRYLKEIYGSKIDDKMQILYVEPQSYDVDDRMGLKDVIGVEGKELEIHYKIFLGKKSAINHARSVVTKAGISVKGLIPKHIATAEAVLTEDEKELGCAVLDIGGGTSNLIIYQENVIRHMAVIPFGGNIITEDIKQCCSISHKNAEQLKKRHGYCITEYAPVNKNVVIKDKNGLLINNVNIEHLAEVIEARVCEIIASAMHEIEASGYASRLKAGVILTGGSTDLIHLPSLVKHITEYKTRLATADNDLLARNSRQDIYNRSYSTAVGLVLTAYLQEKETDVEEEEPEQTGGTIFQEPARTEPHTSRGGIFGKNKKPKTPKKPRSFGDIMDDLFKSTDNDA